MANLNILIAGKLTGLGNNLQWIPAIKQLQLLDNAVYADSPALYETDIAIKYTGSPKIDIVYVVYPYTRNKFWKMRVKYPGARFYGFKYHIGPKVYGYGYTKALTFDETIHETENIAKLIPNSQPYFMPRNIGREKYIGIITATRYKKRYDYWYELIKGMIELKGREKIKVFGEYKGVTGYRWTPEIRDFKRELESCRFVITYEGFGMHLADALEIPMLIIWGYGNYIKNRPINAHWKIDGYDTNPKLIINHYRMIEDKLNRADNLKYKFMRGLKK